MKYFQKQLICCLLSLLLIFFCCFALSFYHQRMLYELTDLCRALPEDLSDRSKVLQGTKVLEQKLKKAGASLAFFMDYEDINEAYLCAASLRYAAQKGDELEYHRTRIALLEALDTLLRFETLSLETII